MAEGLGGRFCEAVSSVDGAPAWGPWQGKKQHVLDVRLALARFTRPNGVCCNCGVVQNQASAHYARAVELDSGSAALRLEAAAVASVRRHIEQGVGNCSAEPQGCLLSSWHAMQTGHGVCEHAGV